MTPTTPEKLKLKAGGWPLVRVCHAVGGSMPERVSTRCQAGCFGGRRSRYLRFDPLSAVQYRALVF